MDETYRMLGREHDADLEREAQRRRLAVEVARGTQAASRRKKRPAQSLRRVVARVAAILTGLGLAVVLAGPAVAVPPANPELNPLFAAEWWLRGHTTLTDYFGVAAPSDGVDATGAWPSASGDGVVVAVLDSGVDLMTPALSGQLVPGRDLLDGRRPMRDPLGHGTHVATIIAGYPQRSDGIFGVAPRASILPLRVATAGGHVRGPAAAAALLYAARRSDVRVVNMSWENESSAQLTRALGTAAQTGSKLLVAAAGNEERDLAGTVLLPQTFDSAAELTVASSDILDGLSWFSNYGAHVEVAAPGERILSAFPAGTLKIEDGTSMAAAVVSGVAALLFSRYPEATAAQVKRAIVSSCTQVPDLFGRVECGGIVNAPGALASLATVLSR